MLLAIEGSPLIKPSVLGAELHVAWTIIICRKQVLRADRIFVEDDFGMVIGWI